MKTLRLFGMAIVAVMLAMPAASCDDDDDDDTQIETTEDGIVTGQKKLVKIVEYREEREGSYVYIDVDTAILRYDSKGRLIRWEEDSYDPEGAGFVYDYTFVQTYTWTENSIAYHYNERGHTGDYTYVLSDNMVTEKAGSYPETYQYDSDKRIALESEKDGSYTYEYNYSWDDDKLVRCYEIGDYDYEYHYSGKTCKGYNPWLADWVSSLAVAHPELFGCRTNLLPDYQIRRYEDGEEERQEYSYTFYGDGYLESVALTYDNGHYYKKTYFWE